jgi:hypothetical protein
LWLSNGKIHPATLGFGRFSQKVILFKRKHGLSLFKKNMTLCGVRLAGDYLYENGTLFPLRPASRILPAAAPTIRLAGHSSLRDAVVTEAVISPASIN